MKTLAQRIQDTQQTIVELRDQLQRSLEAESPDDAAVDQLNGQLETAEKSLATMKRSEANLARASTGTSLTVLEQRADAEQQHFQVGQVTRGNPAIQDTALSARGRLFAVPTQKVRPSDYIFKAVTAAIKHYA